jgi:hypothetical protein
LKIQQKQNIYKGFYLCKVVNNMARLTEHKKMLIRTALRNVNSIIPPLDNFPPQCPMSDTEARIAEARQEAQAEESYWNQIRTAERVYEGPEGLKVALKAQERRYG